MKSIGDHYPTVSNAALIAAAKIRASEKLNPARGLQAQLHEQADPDIRASNGRRKTDMVQSGTDRIVPFRYASDAPRLDAAFVAQLLGQMMPDREHGHTGALAAYGEAPSSALIFDTRL
ncbi:MAG: hypothetical protein ABI963_06585 [Rhizomicrobium sp.]